MRGTLSDDGGKGESGTHCVCAGRSETSGRTDDNLATIKKRFRTFVESVNTPPPVCSCLTGAHSLFGWPTYVVGRLCLLLMCTPSKAVCGASAALHQ